MRRTVAAILLHWPKLELLSARGVIECRQRPGALQMTDESLRLL